MPRARAVTVAGGSTLAFVHARRRSRGIALEPISEQEATEPGHLVPLVELDRVVAARAAEIAVPGRIGIAVAAAIAQKVLAVAPEIDMQRVGMRRAKVEARIAQHGQRPLIAQQCQSAIVEPSAGRTFRRS